MHHAVLAAVAASLSLAGCASLDTGIENQGDRLAVICETEPAIHAAFTVLALATELEEAIVAREYQAHVAVQAICLNPPTDTQTALAAALDAYAAVANAQAAAAEAVEGGV